MKNTTNNTNTTINTKTTITIYDDDQYLSPENWEELKANYAEDYSKKEEDITDDDLYKYMYLLLNRDMEDIKNTIEFYEREHGKKRYIIKGTLGLWNGPVPVIAIAKDLMEVIIKCIEDSNRIYYKDGVFKICASHHDGTNCYEIKEITEEGEEYLEENDCEDGPYEEMKPIFDSDIYSQPVSLFIKAYGLT